MIKEDILIKAQTVFDSKNDFYLFFAPCRANLIGEHIDYNGGRVLPFAISTGIYLAVAPNALGQHRFFSENFLEQGVINIPKCEYQHSLTHSWLNYPVGVLKEFADINVLLNDSCDFYYYGNADFGAGLSSSAAIEMVTAVAINYITDSNLPMINLVKMSKSCENNFVGMNCGIMDQFIVGFGKAGNAVLLNCDNLKYSYVPFVLKDISIILINTNKVRKLTDSKYNERSMECLSVLHTINSIRKDKISCLCDINVDEIACYKHVLDDVLYRRLQHVVTENDRVNKTVKALENNDIETVGKLLYASHDSLKNDYEVSCKELDVIVDVAYNQEGVLGARMTGAGFGGCVISLVKNEFVEAFKEKVEHDYVAKTKLILSFYDVACSDGAKKL